MGRAAVRHAQRYSWESTVDALLEAYAEAAASSARQEAEAAFKRVLKLEDDFSYFARQNRRWKILTIQPEAGILTAIAGTRYMMCRLTK